MTPGPVGCPDPGLIAAHAERRLAGEEAARMDAHLASCPECYEAFAETLRFALDEERSAPGDHPKVLPFVRRPGFRIAAGLVAAAGLVLALHTWGSRSPRIEEATAGSPLVRELAEAMDGRRFVEPRLTGGFRHGRLVVLRSGEASRGLDAYPPAVLAAVARIRERAEADPSPEALGALGVTYLASGDVRAAVETLQSATGQAPDNASLQSDLAAAYLVRARRLDDPADLPRALEAAETAISLQDPPDEAWFNRALALEGLHLTRAARQAWEDYLERDPSSGWAEEARQHLEELPPAAQSSAESEGPRVRAALEEGPRAIERVAEASPSLLRDHLEDELLPAWAAAHLVGGPEAAVLRERAEAIGEALLRYTGDPLVRDTAHALVSPSSEATSGDPLRAQALGFRSFEEARRLYDVQKPSCEPFRRASRLLEEGGSPFALRVRERVVMACLFRGEPGAGVTELRRIGALAEKAGYRHLLGRARRLEGVFLWHRGDLTAALERYRSAQALFHSVGDVQSEAFAFAGIAETLHVLGETRRAWSARTSALVRLARVREPRFRHSILEEGALACLDERLPRSALDFQTEVVEAASRWSNAVAMSDALVRRAAMAMALDAPDAAASDLVAARRWLRQIADPSFSAHLAAEVDAVEGEMLARQRPAEATRSLERALSYFEASSPVRTPALRLLVARAQLARGRESDAEEQLREGIEELESERVSMGDATLQASFFDQAAPLFDEMLTLQIDSRGDAERALDFLERGRARQLADSLRGPPVGELASNDKGPSGGTERPLDAEALQSQVPVGVALVYLSSRDDRLLSWVLTRGACHFAQRSVPGEALRRLVAAYEAALARRAPVGRVRELSARLYDELVRPLAPLIRSQRGLVVVPDTFLAGVAYASLWDRETGHYLVEDHLVGLAPSGTVFVHASARAAQHDRLERRALVVGNPLVDQAAEPGLPPLPGAEAEAVEVARLYEGAELLVGREATKEEFLRLIEDSPVVHFAGHAISGDVPWSARLLLASGSPDAGPGWLRLHELAGRDLSRTRVVVLAACRSAAGTASRLEGPLSLVRPFLAAGVPSVVGSLWDVDDEVSRPFFVAFHRALIQEGDAFVALAHAQNELLHHGEPLHSHPASWAGFVAVGGMDPFALTGLLVAG